VAISQDHINVITTRSEIGDDDDDFHVAAT